MSIYSHVPDACLLAIAKVSWNRLELDDRLEVWEEVLKRWEESLQNKRVEAIADKLLQESPELNGTVHL